MKSGREAKREGERGRDGDTSDREGGGERKRQADRDVSEMQRYAKNRIRILKFLF